MTLTPRQKKVAIGGGVAATLAVLVGSAYAWRRKGHGDHAKHGADAPPPDAAAASTPATSAPPGGPGAAASTDADGAKVAPGDPVSATTDQGEAVDGTVEAVMVDVFQVRGHDGRLHRVPRHRLRKRAALALYDRDRLLPEILHDLPERPRHEEDRQRAERLDRERGRR